MPWPTSWKKPYVTQAFLTSSTTAFREVSEDSDIHALMSIVGMVLGSSATFDDSIVLVDPVVVGDSIVLGDSFWVLLPRQPALLRKSKNLPIFLCLEQSALFWRCIDAVFLQEFFNLNAFIRAA